MPRQSTNLHAVIDGKFSNDQDLMSIFSKLIVDILSNSSSRDLYTRCRMNFTDDPVQIKTPKFMDMRFYTINALDEGSGLNTPDTRIQRPMNGAYWISPNNILVKLQQFE